MAAERSETSLTSKAKRHWLASKIPLVSRVSDAVRQAREILSVRPSIRGPSVCSTGLGPRQAMPVRAHTCDEFFGEFR